MADKRIRLAIPRELADRVEQLRQQLDTSWHDATFAEAIRYALEKGVETALQEGELQDD